MQRAVEGILDGWAVMMADGAVLLQEYAGVATLVATGVEQSSLSSRVVGEPAGGAAGQRTIWGRGVGYRLDLYRML